MKTIRILIKETGEEFCTMQSSDYDIEECRVANYYFDKSIYRLEVVEEEEPEDEQQ